LMIQGGADMCDDAKESEDLDACFTSYYRRAVLKGIGHFPHREAPGEVAKLLIEFLAQNQ
jgi:pimeloyl-ACP methyl ester carboxylesterase